jgi:hypothetical protein
MPSNYAMIMSWDRQVPGREAQGNELKEWNIKFWTEQQRAGKIESFEWFILTPHGGCMNGFLMVRGDRKKIDDLIWGDDFMSMMHRAALVCTGLTLAHAFCAGGASKLMEGREGAVLKYAS